MRKYFELEEDRLVDFLKRDEAWAKQRKEAEELKKKMVSCGPGFLTEFTSLVRSLEPEEVCLWRVVGLNLDK